MLRVFLGIVKGGLVGGLLGLVATKLGLAAGVAAWGLYGVVGLLVGVVCGTPVWHQATLWTPLVKGIFGAGIAMGLFWLARKVLGEMPVPVASPLWATGQRLAAVPALLAPAIGIVYGVFVEVDDGADKADSRGKSAA